MGLIERARLTDGEKERITGWACGLGKPFGEIDFEFDDTTLAELLRPIAEAQLGKALRAVVEWLKGYGGDHGDDFDVTAWGLGFELEKELEDAGLERTR